MTERFDWTSLLARVLFGFFIVFAAYNPSGHSFWHWALNGSAGVWTKFSVGTALLGMHGFVITNVLGVLKWRGILLIVALLFGSWMALAPSTGFGGWNGSGIVIVLLSGLALLYAAGLSYSHIHHRLAGVSHVEKVK